MSHTNIDSRREGTLPETDRAAAREADDVTSANEGAAARTGGSAGGEPARAAGKEALGTRLRSTDSVDRATEPLSGSESDDTSESGPSNRYAER